MENLGDMLERSNYQDQIYMFENCWYSLWYYWGGMISVQIVENPPKHTYPLQPVEKKPTPTENHENKAAEANMVRNSKISKISNERLTMRVFCMIQSTSRGKQEVSTITFLMISLPSHWYKTWSFRTVESFTSATNYESTNTVNKMSMSEKIVEAREHQNRRSEAESHEQANC